MAMEREKSKFIKDHVYPDPPIECGLKVGDTVKWRNDNGVVWENKVVGFDKDVRDRFIYLDTDCYWFPERPDCIFEVNGKPYKAL